MNTQDLEIINEQKRKMLNEVSAREYYQIGTRLDENDARAIIKGIMEHHAGIVFDVVAKKYIHNLATLEVMDSFMRSRI